MSAQTGRTDDSAIQWTQATSMKGVPFEVGFDKGDVAEAEGGDAKESGPQALVANNAAMANAATRDISVKWFVEGNVWKDISGDLSVYLSRYKLDIASGNIIYNWRLDITNKLSGLYRFFDETGDYYDIQCNKNRDHYVKFNSDKPTIVLVRYWAN